MPTSIKTHKLQTLKPRIKELAPRLRTLPTRTLKQRQEANGRTLALNGAAWARLRSLVLSEQPLCPECERMGRIMPARDVDHVDNDASNNERSNLVGLCTPCHSVKTQRHEHFLRTGTWLPVKGCDVHGMPLDPQHAWNREKSPEPQGYEPTVYLHARDRT
nr:HNH endonuclease signature motif containing protein [uncultured Noviherbaspirillum sp.]